MNAEAQIVAVLGEGQRALDGGALFDVFENLRIAGFEADNEQAAASLFHRLQRIAVGGDARSAAPGDAEWLQLRAQLDGPDFLNIEGVVVEEELLDVGEVLLGPGQFGGHIVGGALAPGVSAERLRPQAEGALRRAAACRIERDERVQQEGHAVTRHVHVPLVDLGGPGHRVQIFDLRPVGVVNDLAVEPVADTQNLVERLALGKFDDGIIELAAADEVERGALIQSAVRVGGHGRSNKGDANRRVCRLDGHRQTLIARPAYCRGEEHQELVVLANVDCLLGGDVVRRSVQQTRALEHAGGVSEPDGVPIGLNLARCGPARTRAAVEIFEGGRVQK